MIKLLQMRWRIKGCPRCKGALNYNPYSDDWACLQCGYVEYTRKQDRVEKWPKNIDQKSQT